MKVILRTDIEKLGTIGDVVNVKPGFARNYLLPQGYAYLADKGSLKRFEEEKKRLTDTASRERGKAEELKAKLEEQKLTVEVKTGDQGRLYGSVTAKNIAELLEAASIPVDRRHIRMETPIKALGDFEVPIKLYGDITATVKVSVIDAEADIRAAIEAEIAALEAAEAAEEAAARGDVAESDEAPAEVADEASEEVEEA
jgi:large subunit ribosomal protein L9